MKKLIAGLFMASTMYAATVAYMVPVSFTNDAYSRGRGYYYSYTNTSNVASSPWIIIPRDVYSVAVEFDPVAATNMGRVETTCSPVDSLGSLTNGVIWSYGNVQALTTDALLGMVTAIKLYTVSNRSVIRVRAQ